MNAKWTPALALAVFGALALACGGSGGSDDHGGSSSGGTSSGGTSSGGTSSGGTSSGGTSSGGTSSGGTSSGGTSSGGTSSGGTSSGGTSSGGTSSGGLTTQAAYEWLPETCDTNNHSWTDVIIMVAEATNYCKYVANPKPFEDITCPPSGEKVLQIVIGRSSYQGAVERIGTGTYAWPNAMAFLLTGDTTNTCVSKAHAATGGSLTLTSITGGYQGSYDFVIDGQHVQGSLDSQRCWSGEDSRGPCANETIETNPPGCKAVASVAFSATTPCSGAPTVMNFGEGKSVFTATTSGTDGGFSATATIAGVPAVNKTYTFTSATTEANEWYSAYIRMTSAGAQIWQGEGGPAATARSGSLSITFTSVEAQAGGVAYTVHGTARAMLPASTGATGQVTVDLTF